ncbi:MAG TPA: tripartite tricarboxylate transporter TctB family protein [Roseomonas sp.]|jgi:putative tricarboxylic transport membrane protein
MQLSDRVTGAVIATVGVAAAWAGSRLADVPGQDVGPSVFPMIIGGGMLVCGVLIALGIGSGLEVPKEDAATPRPWHYGLRALLPPALLVFYMLAAETLGFLITAAILVGALAVALGARWRLALPLALVAPFFVHAVFVKLLRVPLPDGLMAAPW